MFEDDHTLAFLSIGPIHKGHTLVIPKEHFENIFDIDAESVAALYRSARKVAPAVRDATGADGVNIHNNNGAAAGQEVFHYHVHIIPRFENDGLIHWSEDKYEEGEMSEYRERIVSKI